jgi:hypothetical protein
VRRVYREILDDSVRRQRDWLQAPADEGPPLTVAYQGTEGAYGHEAALRHFGVERRAVTFKPYRSFRETLDALRGPNVHRTPTLDSALWCEGQAEPCAQHHRWTTSCAHRRLDHSRHDQPQDRTNDQKRRCS